MTTITPTPRINKAFDAPLAARPIPIRTGSLSPSTLGTLSPPPARSRTRLRQATSTLGMRAGLQGISGHLRSLTMPHRAGAFGVRSGGSSSGSSSSGGSASRKGAGGRPPIVIGRPFFDNGESRDTTAASGVPPRFCALPVHVDGLPTPAASLPALGPRTSAMRMPGLTAEEFDQLRAQGSCIPEHSDEPQQTPEDRHHAETISIFDVSSNMARSITSATSSSPYHTATKRSGGVHHWDIALDVDRDALQDAPEDHPSPLNSNPTSDNEASEPTTPWASASLSPGLGSGAEFNPYWPQALTPSPKRRSRSITLASVPRPISLEPNSTLSSPISTHTDEADPSSSKSALPQLHHEIAKLRAANSALLTLKVAYEETIALLRDNLRNRDSAIAKLTWQVQAKETEQLCVVENFCAEMSSRNEQIESLREDKWFLMGEIAQLEQKIKELDVAGGSQHTQGTSGNSASQGDDPFEDIEQNNSDRVHASLTGTASSHRVPPFSRPLSTARSFESPATITSSLLLPRPCSGASNRSLYATTQVLSFNEASSPRASRLADSENCPRPYRNHERARSQPEDDCDDQAESRAVQYPRHSRVSQIIAAQIVLSAKEKLEQSLYTTQEKLVTAETHTHELQAQLATQAAHFQQFSRASAGPILASSAFMSIPDLPVLTYTRSSAAWNDRVLASFKYLGLLDFIQRDVPRPETSTWDAAEVADWTSRRLRAVVLLKHAVDDDILEDVLHVCGRRETAPGLRDLDGSVPAMEDPHQLYNTITCLRRIISPTASDLTWLDRIRDPDFDGIEGFTSLVLCVDKRHGIMYGTSADHYDALVPKLLEIMARRFPDTNDSTFGVASAGSLPKKWRQLSVWMAKVVKKRQISEGC